jgi:hypothetical protein
MSAAVEDAYLAALPRREGKIWVAIDTHQIPYWGRGKLIQFQIGRSPVVGNHVSATMARRAGDRGDQERARPRSSGQLSAPSQSHCHRLPAPGSESGHWIQIERAQGRPTPIREPRAFRAQHVGGLGLFDCDGTDIVLHRSAVDLPCTYDLPWTHCAVRLVA